MRLGVSSEQRQRETKPADGFDDLNQGNLLERITSRPDVFGDKPIVRDLHISVELVPKAIRLGGVHALR